MRTQGLKDEPVSGSDLDLLGVGSYAQTLSDFILKCDTPMTIAIQGDWGSGKTSLMNLIRQQVERQGLPTIWFNTWQYAQFGQSENLAVSFLSEFVDEWPKGKEFAPAARAVISRMWRFGVVAAASAVGVGEQVKEGLEAASGSGQEPVSPSRAVRELKAELEKMVSRSLGGDPNARVVVFIDDLDRLVPIRAVELLEVMKLFLDLKGCVFVLACDYQVVVQGLTAKFGPSAQFKGKSFFDKIIQVPFNMPVHRYEVDRYFRELLRRVDDRLDPSQEESEIYKGLVETSIGFNPRGIKRVLNALLLLVHGLTNESQVCTHSEWVRILFASLCLQNAYPGAFAFLCRTALSRELLNAMCDEKRLDSDPAFAQIWEEVDEADRQRLPKALAGFMAAVREAIHLESQGTRKAVSDTELQILANILRSSAVTATVTTKAAERSNEDFLRDCDASEQAYYRQLFEFLDRERMDYRMGTVGFSIRDRSGTTVARIYPTSARRSIEIVTKGMGPDDSLLREFVRSPEQRQRLERREVVSLKPADIPVEALCQVVANLAVPQDQ